MEGFDVIVVGLGAHGSSIVYELASKGTRVLGLEQFHPTRMFGLPLHLSFSFQNLNVEL